ncbi:MAG: spore coat protein [Bacillota bacterium]
MQNQMAQPQFNLEGGRLVMFHQDHTGLPQTKDPTVNDRDRMQDLLSQEKYLTDAYNVAMFEAGHDELSETIKENFDQCHRIQREIYSTMFQKGWYKLPVADAESVMHTFNQFQQYQVQLPFPSGRQQGQMDRRSH